MEISYDIYLFFEIAGTIAFAIAGALVAIRNKMDISGIIILAFITGNGGGTIRDLILDAPVFWTQHLLYIFVSIVPAILVFLAYCYFSKILRSKRFKHLLEIVDALGLVAFTIGGASKAMMYQEPATVCVMLGVLTAVGGGMLRDIFAGESPMIFKSQLYVTPTLFGAIVFMVMSHYSANLALLLSSASILFLRFMGIYYNWHLPFPKVLRK